MSAGLIALGAAPLWIAATHVHPALSLLALIPVVLHRSGLPRAVPWLVLSLAGVQAVRLVILVDPLPSSAGLGLLIFAGGLAAAGAAAAPPGRTTGAAVAASGALLLALSGLAWQQSPTTPSDIQRAGRFGVLTLQPLPSGTLASTALTVEPGWHDLAQTLPPEEALRAGWRPAGAPLTPPERVRVARLLERSGDGSAGLRLLGEDDAEMLRWWQVLFKRIQGQPVSWTAGVLPDVELIALEGYTELELLLSQSGSTELLLHSLQDHPGLVLTVSGEWFEGPPELEIVLDDRMRIVQVSTEEMELELGALSAGPHRLLLRFLNDLQGTRGDRNVTVHALRVE
ncbi:MAG: hypothetical protein P8R54_20885 [Myxococcota bacterium]|nr:hypothetical protein [Myxococcota bacterium]